MATKRIAKRGRLTGESSSARGERAEGRSKKAHDRNPNSPSRFRSEKHRNLYESQTKRRTIIPERPLTTVNSLFDSLPLTPLARGWGQFVSHPSIACKNIVREFYANGKDLPGTRNLPKGETYVRGYQVNFDSHTINALLGIPPPAEGEVCYYDAMVKNQFDPDEVIRELCVPGAKWTEKVDGSIKGILRQNLKPLPMEFLHFILASIHPSKHCYEVTLERVYILYNMMTGRYMDLGRILADELAKSVESNRAITCPSLVYKLCLHAGVPGVLEDEIAPGPVLGVKPLHRKNLTAMPSQQSDEDEEAYRERSAAHEEPPPTAGEARILAALERNQRTLERNERRTNKLIKFVKYLYKEVRSLKQHFRKRNRSPSPSNPPDLSSSSQPEEEKASEDDGDEEQAAAAGSQGSQAEESEHDIEEDSDE